MERNPYLDRVAIRDTARFFGRKREVSRIFSRFGAARPQSVSVVGERRIGKSSLLNYIAAPEVRGRMLEDVGRYVFIKMDFQERRQLSLEEFLREMILLMQSAADFSGILTPDFEGVRAAVASLQKKGKKIIILFDEFDVVTSNPHFGEEFFSFFRSLANNYDLAYLTSSRRDLQELCHTTKIADSPFFNIFSTLNLGGFTADEALQLINVPSMRAGIPLDPFAGEILDMAGDFPFFIQIACSAFYEHLTLGDGAVDPAQVRESFREEVTPHFNYLWEHFSKEERGVLDSVRRGEPVHPSSGYLLKKLERGGYLFARDGRPAVFSSVFGEFMEEKAQAEREMLAETIQVPASREELESFLAQGDTDRLEQLGTFRIDRKLGEGGMGMVYLAEDLQLGRQVAIKVLSPRMINDTVMRRRFIKEARSASALNHPNICTIYQVGQESGLDFIVMEFVEGQTLKEMIQQRPFEPAVLARVGIQIAEALAHAHARRLIHRDVKPANIMINAEGRVKILDFGLVKWLAAENLPHSTASGLTEQGAILGTVHYMSPEQIKGEAVDHRTDLFSLGVVLYEMAGGKPPYAAENYVGIMHAILYQPPPPLPPGVPPALSRIVFKALEKDPSDRYPSADEVRADLTAFLRSGA